MPAIHMSDAERDSLFQLAQSPAPPGEIPAEHASRFVALGLAVRETLRFRITLRGQVEILRQRFRKMPLSRVAKVTKKHFLATFEERFSDLPLLGQRTQPPHREPVRRVAPPAQSNLQQPPRPKAPGGIPPPNPGLPAQQPPRPGSPAPKMAPAGQQARPPAVGPKNRQPPPGQQMRPPDGQPSRPEARPQSGQLPRPEARPQSGQLPRPNPQPGRNPQAPQWKGPPARPKQR